MILSNPQQFSVLLWSLLFGVGLGIVYDLLRCVRVFVRCGTVSVFFQDLLYFLVAAVASFAFIFEVNDGTVRMFILFAFLAGGLFCRFTLGNLTVRLCCRMKKAFSARNPGQTQQHTQPTATRCFPHKRRKDRYNKCIKE